MRAIGVEQFGEPEVLEPVELPDPVAADGEVLIDVEAAGVNYGDLLVRSGQYMGRSALPVVPGWEVVGRRVDNGARVVCLLAGGGYAERVAAPERDVVAIADDVDDAVALALVIQGATAWQLLERPSPLLAGEHLLVTGAGSGVTHLLIQLALIRAAGRIVVVASSQEKARRVLALGADAAVIDNPVEDLGDRVRAALAVVERRSPGAHLLVDHVGAPLFDALIRCLRPGGRAVVYGVAGGKPALVNTGAMLKRGLTVSGLWLGHGAALPLQTVVERLIELWREGRLKPTLGPQLPLAAAAEAHRLVAARTAVGKVVLRVR